MHSILPAHFKATLSLEQPINQWLVAFSGGMDSSVLLSLVQQTLPLHLVKVIHFDHGLHPHSAKWAVHCQRQCEHYGISFECIRLFIQRGHRQSIETMAREHRYFHLKERMREDTALLLAHHQEDQAETLLFRIFRGTGLDGLQCMQTVTRFGKGWICRPLLAYQKQSLQAYAKQHALTWVEDESNADCQYARNYIRHKIMPLITARWPQAVAQMNQITTFAKAFVDDGVHDVAAMLAMCQGPDKNQLNLASMQQFSWLDQQTILRAWIKTLGHQMPSFDQMQRLRTEVMMAAPDRCPLLRMGSYHFRRYRQTLYLYSNRAKIKPRQMQHWDLKQASSLSLDPQHQLKASISQGQGFKSSLFADGVKVIRGCHGKRAKKIFQTHGIPPWQRTNYVSIFAGPQWVETVGLAQNQKLYALGGETGITFEMIPIKTWQ